MGVGKERDNKNWSMVKPEKAAPVTGTALRNTGPMQVDTRQREPSVAIARPEKIGTDPMAVEGIYECLRRNGEKSHEEAPYPVF